MSKFHLNKRHIEIPNVVELINEQDIGVLKNLFYIYDL